MNENVTHYAVFRFVALPPGAPTREVQPSVVIRDCAYAYAVNIARQAVQHTRDTAIIMWAPPNEAQTPVAYVRDETVVHSLAQ